jgi:hypothetical protein
MSNSNLVNYTLISPHKTVGNFKKKKFTIHHMAGVLTVEQCGKVFQSREASTNYGVDANGRIGMYVEEKDRAWATANYNNDCQSINIEVANDKTGGDWHVSDKAIETLIKLMVECAKRNGIDKLVYDGTKNGNVTTHDMFVATQCPGAYLKSKIPYIVAEVNKQLTNEEPKKEIVSKYKIGDKVRINGVYRSSNSTEKLNPLRYSGTITAILTGTRNPYLLDDGNLGWVNNDCIVSTKVDESIKVGDKVIVTKPVDWYGTSLAVSGTYDVIEVSGSRIVIGKGKAVTCAIHKDNLKKV